jgi:hypothetical protein
VLSGLPDARWRDFDPEDMDALPRAAAAMAKSNPNKIIAQGTD